MGNPGKPADQLHFLGIAGHAGRTVLQVNVNLPQIVLAQSAIMIGRQINIVASQHNVSPLTHG
jgi:hypothetical protein